MYFSHASSLISSEGLVLSWSVRHFPSKICWQILSFLLELHWFQLHLIEENKVHQQLLHFAKHQTPLVQFCPKFRQPTLNDISQSFLCQIADFYDLTPFFFCWYHSGVWFTHGEQSRLMLSIQMSPVLSPTACRVWQRPICAGWHHDHSLWALLARVPGMTVQR